MFQMDGFHAVAMYMSFKFFKHDIYRWSKVSYRFNSFVNFYDMSANTQNTFYVHRTLNLYAHNNNNKKMFHSMLIMTEVWLRTRYTRKYVRPTVM